MKSEFTTKPLSALADIQTGPFGSQLHKEDYVQNGTPIVTVEHLGQKRFTEKNLPCVSEIDKERLNKYILREGDVVFSRVGSVDRCSYDNASNWIVYIFGKECGIDPTNLWVEYQAGNYRIVVEALYWYRPVAGSGDMLKNYAGNRWWTYGNVNNIAWWNSLPDNTKMLSNLDPPAHGGGPYLGSFTNSQFNYAICLDYYDEFCGYDAPSIEGSNMLPGDLKEDIKAGKIKVVNLTLTKDGRLVDGAEPKEPKGKTLGDVYKNYNLGRYASLSVNDPRVVIPNSDERAFRQGEYEVVEHYKNKLFLIKSISGEDIWRTFNDIKYYAPLRNAIYIKDEALLIPKNIKELPEQKIPTQEVSEQ